jgi:hypothetical protein
MIPAIATIISPVMQARFDYIAGNLDNPYSPDTPAYQEWYAEQLRLESEDFLQETRKDNSPCSEDV